MPAENLVNPYVGPRPFERTQQDSARFFGRALETKEILSLILGHPIVLVYAQSGAGKTSLFNASVVPALECEGFDVLPLTRVRGSIPKDVRPEEIQNLYTFNALMNLGSNNNPGMIASQSLLSYLSALPRTKKMDRQQTPRVLIFDQFEELFTYTPEHWREQREGFFSEVIEALKADPLLRVVFVIREDFLAELDPYASRLPEHLRIRYRLERLQMDAALRAIRDPLCGTFRSYAPGVAEALVTELLRTKTMDADGNVARVVGQYVEPVQLQVVCLTLWSTLPPETAEITEHQLEGFNVDIALSDYFGAAIKSVSDETGVEEAKLRRWFEKYLITPMQTRNYIYRDKGSTGGLPNSVVDVLVDRHLILAENRGGIWWYELTHDRFIEAIVASNKDWFSGKRVANPLTYPAQEWDHCGREEVGLLRGTRFRQANEWAQAHPDDLDDLEREFLKTCQERYQSRLESKARMAWTLRILSIALAAGLLVAAIAAVSAVMQKNIAQKATNEALGAVQDAISAKNDALKAETQARYAEAQARSGQLALHAITNLKSFPQLGLLLALEAYHVKPTIEADDALRQAVDASRVQAILRQQNTVSAIAFSPQGDYLVTGDTGGVVNVWNVKNGEKSDQWGTGVYQHDSIMAIAFSSNGERFVTVSADGAICLWDIHPESLADSSYEPDTLEEPGEAINGATFSPDGKVLVTYSANGTATVWLVYSGQPKIRLEGMTAQVDALAISPSGDRLATSSPDGTTTLWDLKTRNKLAQLKGHTYRINALIFSPDGNLLLSVGAEPMAYLWQAATGEQLALLMGHTDSILGAAFSPDGKVVATVSADTTARLWDVESVINTGGFGTEGRALVGHNDRINTAAFSPDGQWLATGSADGTANMWKVQTGELGSVFKGHTSSVNGIRFSPDGKQLATASSDDTVILWDTSSGEVQKSLRGHTSTIWEIKFNPEGNLLASKGEDGLILWRLPKDLHTQNIQSTSLLSEFGLEGFGLDFSPDGKFLLAIAVDEEQGTSTVSLLDSAALPNEKILAKQILRDNIAFDTAFKPDGSLVAIDTVDPTFRYSTIHLWHIPGEREEQIQAVDTLYYGLAFSPDGGLLAAAGANSTGGTTSIETGMVKLWDMSSLDQDSRAGEIATIITQKPLIRVAFNHEGSILAGSGMDGTIYLWDVQDLKNTGGINSKVTTLSGHKSEIIGLAFSPDGNLLASGDQDGLVRLWDIQAAIENDGRDAELSILRGQAGGVYSIAFSPDGKWLATAGEDQIVHLLTIDPEDLLTLACQRATRNLTQTEWDTYIGKNKEYHQTCDNLPYHASALNAMIEQGRSYVIQGKIEEGRAILEKVYKLDPSREQPNKLLASMLVSLGHQYAYEGYKDRALRALQKAADLDSSLHLDLDKEIAAAQAQKNFDLMQGYADSGDYNKVLDAMHQAVELDPDLEVRQATEMATLYNSICWNGSIDGFADIVLPVCKRAVELADMSNHSYIGGIRDSRGLARALTGDYAGAIEDFSYYVDWARSANEPEDSISLREGWIKLLKAGRNPFKEDPSLLQSLR